MSLHIGILQTDAVRPEFQAAHGDYPAMFRDLFSARPLAQQADIHFTTYDVQRGMPDDTQCDAYVITGSKLSVYDDLEWIRQLAVYLQEVLDAGKKVVGVCFGHQLIAHFFGGQVQPAEGGWAVGVHHSDVVCEHPWMVGDTKSVGLLSSHKDQVIELPDGAQIYLRNDFCPIAGFTIKDQVLTVQGHPEFSKDFAAELMNFRRTMLGEDIYQRGMASLGDPTREYVMADWILQFAAG